jgi:GNAT superfamily N-acetyltransferase
MVASTISRVEGNEEAIRTLTWLGASFFAGPRLDRFTFEAWSHLRSPDEVDWPSAGPLAPPRVELWVVRDERDTILGAMTLHFYSWDRLKRQYYFAPQADRAGTVERVCVRRFERIVAGATGSIAPFDVAAELGYVAVAPEARGKGLGRTLFDIFQHRAATVCEGRALAFTIVLARHAHSDFGHALMSTLLAHGAQDAATAVSWRALGPGMRLPHDLFAVEREAYPTAWMAEHRGFAMAGYGKNLGQVWVKDLELAARQAVAPTWEGIVLPRAATPLFAAQ